MKYFSKITWMGYAVLLLTLIGFVIRIYHVDFLTLWVDEFVHVDRARFFPEQALFTDDNNGILYTIFILPFFKLFGVNELWARFPSVVLGTLSIPLSYYIGKKWFKKEVGFYAAILVAFSQYLIFWSRVARNYSIYLFFYLVAIYFVYELIVALAKSEKIQKWSDRFSCLWKPFLFALVALFLGLLSHQLSFMLLFAIGFYYIFMWIKEFYVKRKLKLNLTSIIGGLFFLFMISSFIPSIQNIIKGGLVLFLPQRVVDWVLPNLPRLRELLESKPFSSFDLYKNVFLSDYTYLWWIGILGLFIAIKHYKNKGLYLFALCLPIFLLMSFVYREPSLPRYLIATYGCYLLAMAIGIDWFMGLLLKLSPKKIRESKMLQSLIIGGLLVVLSPVKASVEMVSADHHGRVVPYSLCQWYYPNWKNSLNTAKKYIKPDDVVLATITTYSNFYLDKEVIQFRQKYYDTKQHAYLNFKPDLSKPNAQSLEALKKLYDENDRGWVFVDYYFNNPLTDPKARAFITSHTKLLYLLSNGFVRTFFWDKSIVKDYPTFPIAEVVDQYNERTQKVQTSLPNIDNVNKDFLNVLLTIEGYSRLNEVFLVVNKQAVGIPLVSNENKGKLQTVKIQVPKRFFISNNVNEFFLMYNDKIANEKTKVMLLRLDITY